MAYPDLDGRRAIVSAGVWFAVWGMACSPEHGDAASSSPTTPVTTGDTHADTGMGNDVPSGSAGSTTSGAAGGSGTAVESADARWLEYIRGDHYSRLEFEVDSVAGLEPSDGASAPVLS